MKTVKLYKGHYEFIYDNKRYEVIINPDTRTWKICGFGGKRIAGGRTKKEALVNFNGKMKRLCKTYLNSTLRNQLLSLSNFHESKSGQGTFLIQEARRRGKESLTVTLINLVFKHEKLCKEYSNRYNLMTRGSKWNDN